MKPKLGDFGTSKILQTMIAASTFVGSIFYMSPEIIEGDHGDPLPSDIYRYLSFIVVLFVLLLIINVSFGVLMHELATSAVSVINKLKFKYCLILKS